ncbi:MAG: hypothetical protein J3Q66DRAFT_119471, partial [Benniella sp.]
LYNHLLAPFSHFFFLLFFTLDYSSSLLSLSLLLLLLSSFTFITHTLSLSRSFSSPHPSSWIAQGRVRLSPPSPPPQISVIMSNSNNPQQQQNMAVWTPTVPAYAKNTPGVYNISGPLGLKTSDPQPSLPPIRDVQPPPARSIPQRAASLRRQPSQTGPRYQQPSINTSNIPIPINPSYPDNDTQTQGGYSGSSSPYNSSQIRLPATPGGSLHPGETSQESTGLQRSNSKVNYSSPLFRSHSRSNSRSGSSATSSPSGSLRRQASILKNGSKDAPYLTSGKGHIESLNQSWEPSSQNPALFSTPTSPSTSNPLPSLTQYGSASNLRAMAQAAQAAQAVQAVQAAQAQAETEATSEGTEVPPPTSSSSIKSAESTTVPPSGERPNSQGATGNSDSAQDAQSSLPPELKDTESNHIPARDSANYKVLVPPSPVVSPHMGPTSTGTAQSAFNFLNSDPTVQRSTSKKRLGPSVQVPPPHPSPHPQQLQNMTSPISPARRHPHQGWENMMPLQDGEYGQGQDQDHQDDGDHEDYDTDGDALSGPEDQAGRRRRQKRPDNDNGAYTPTRTAPPPTTLPGGIVPNSREAEIAHILYIQQQQALFLQEKAMNPPLKSKSSNGNISGTEGSKPRRKLSLHRKQIAVISEPTLVSSTNQVKTVPIVRPAEQSDNEDAGAKSEYTSGGEGIKKTVRRLRKAVRHAATNVFQDDDSDREEAVGSKSDVEKKGGLKQLKTLKTKIAKKLNRPKNDQQGGANDQEGGDNTRGPAQFLSEENLRSKYQEQGGSSFAAAGASLRRSNTTRDSKAGPMFNLRSNGDKQEYESGDEGQEGGIHVTPASPTTETNEIDAATKARLAKMSSRTFDNDEMIEVKDGTGESFFVPRWDFDPKTESSTVVINVQSKKSNTSKSLTTITEQLQTESVAATDADSTESQKSPDSDPTSRVPETATASSNNEPAAESVVDEKAAISADDEKQSSPKTPTLNDPVVPSPADQMEKETPPLPAVDANATPLTPELDSRASVLSSARSSGTPSVIVAQVLTRKTSMRRDYKRQNKNDPREITETTQALSEESEEGDSQVTAPKESSPRLGLGIVMPPPKDEIQQGTLEETMAELMQQQGEKELPPLPLEVLTDSPDPNLLGAMTVRPLSPIRRGANNLGRSPSMASLSSALSSPSTPPVSTNSSALALDAQSTIQAPAPARLSDQEPGSKKLGLQKLSLGSSFTLPQAPTSPLPSPSLPVLTASAATPTTPVAPATSTLPSVPIPFPAVLARQASHLTERGSVRSMYADSIYDCYDYESGSDNEGPLGDDPSRAGRQGSFSSHLSVEQYGPPPPLGRYAMEREVRDAAVAGEANVTTATANETSTLAVSLTHDAEKIRKSSSSPKPTMKAGGAQETQDPVVRLRSKGAPKDTPAPLEEDQQHVHYEDIPKAVPYRMSGMMTTVPIEPVGVAGAMPAPSRPPRHPMRQSRQGSINTLISDMTSDSWQSSSVLYNQDDLSEWNERIDLDGNRIGDMLRRPSNASSMSHNSSSSRSERTLSMMTDRSQTRMLDLTDESPLRRSASAASSSVRFPRNESQPDPTTPKQWHRIQQRDTWGSIQSSSSDSRTSEDSAPSSHFYFGGRSPSPSDETAPASNAF